MSGTLKDTGCKPQSHGESPPGDGPCARCNRPRCSAGVKGRPGERCRNNPHPGATICGKHGLTKAGREAAARKRTEAAAGEVVEKLIWKKDAPPVTNAVAALQQLAGQVLHAMEVLGEDLDIGSLEDDQVRARAWLQVVREGRQLLADIERLGIDERMSRMEERTVQQILAAYMDSQRVAVSLPAAERDQMVVVFLSGLGYDDPAELEGAES